MKLDIRALAWMLIISVVSSVFASCAKIEANESQLEFYDGLENQTIINIYGDDINDVYRMGVADRLFIDYAVCDLNGNNLSDLIVLIRSPIHSGSHGDLLNVLINCGDGKYEIVASYIVQMYDQISPGKPVVFISAEKTKGFKNIILQQPDNDIVLVYTDGMYSIMTS